LEDPVADELSGIEGQTISAAELMAMTPEQREALGFRIVRDPENLPADVRSRAQEWMGEIARTDAERPSRRYVS
jgi:hypothetical protein